MLHFTTPVALRSFNALLLVLGESLFANNYNLVDRRIEMICMR